jgi:hypothetical protein
MPGVIDMYVGGGSPTNMSIPPVGDLYKIIKLTFRLTICGGRRIGPNNTVVGDLLPVHYDRPPPTNYL